jgi:tubulin-like protein CetZ
VKLLVIGLGQCGGRIADEFARIGLQARSERGIDIITGAFAVNTDVADLSGLVHIKPDYQHRILIGAKKTGGHGVGKINELAAEIAREDSDNIAQSIRAIELFQDTDAFLLCAGAAGGTGSGSIATVTEFLKERFPEKPFYNLIILPFQHEEAVEGRSIYNCATCLKSSYLVSDAVFLADNQRFIQETESIRSNLARINTAIVEPFYNMLCTGEEQKTEYIGSRMLDAGDIIQSLSGWTVIGHGTSQTAGFKLFKRDKTDFRGKASGSLKGMQAMNKAIAELSLRCNPSDAGKGFYLLSAPPEEMDLTLIKELGSYLKSIASQAVIRVGDYPRGKVFDVTIILSEMADIKKVTDYFARAIEFIGSQKKRQDSMSGQIQKGFNDIPTLL